MGGNKCRNKSKTAVSVVHDPRRHASAEQAIRRIAGVLALLLLCPASHSHTPRASPRADGIGFVILTSTRDPCYSLRSRDYGICQTLNADIHTFCCRRGQRPSATCRCCWRTRLTTAGDADNLPTTCKTLSACAATLWRRRSYEYVVAPSRLLTIS